MMKHKGRTKKKGWLRAICLQPTFLVYITFYFFTTNTRVSCGITRPFHFDALRATSLCCHTSRTVYLPAKPSEAKSAVRVSGFSEVLSKATSDKKLLEKIADGLSVMDKNAEIQRDRKGNIIYDKETKDTEQVKWEESIEDYMAREVLPHIPDAAAFFEENLSAKKPVIKTGAEIPFTRYFYKYQQPTASEELATRFSELERSVSERVAKLFG